ncbi:MAG: aspartyl/asparaginyl beta-hydroxylase domain-containing protein [Acidobacteriota bacterium]|nr:aspartyl/asparaginyl beta-hydroxylase domain-containing protein [Acidobacteriota bacterium]
MDQDVTGRTDAELLRETLESAQARHGAAALRRMEDAVEVAEGRKPPYVSPEPLQRPGFYLPGLTATPWHDPLQHPAGRILEESWEVIRDEVIAARDRREGFQRFLEVGDIASADLSTALFLKQEPLSCADNRALCPRTAAIVDAIPRVGEVVMVSALNPGAKLVPHCGPWNFRLTMHLGLVIPEGGWIRVANETRTWQEGKCLLFDDSFDHEVQIHARSTRIILLMHLWHPELTDPEVDFLAAVRSALAARDRDRTIRMVEEARRNLAGQKWWVDA